MVLQVRGRKLKGSGKGEQITASISSTPIILLKGIEERKTAGLRVCFVSLGKAALAGAGGGSGVGEGTEV